MQLSSRKHITNRPTGNAKERSPKEAIKEPRNKQGLDIRRPCTWYDPDNVNKKRDQIHWFSTVELAQGSQNHGTQRQADNEKTQAQRRHDLTDLELFHYLIVRGYVD